ncbi:MAG: type II secretion system F family protein [Cyanobacteria bacterium SZAS LIN-3]|nr:type II secretion system F family protein [Cyanobacteria bacterium SZAS LIN-3]MBS2007285.1 type II secretion system F family protein [Cyanobacteria bacterium SZAS TMP-1]
MKVDLLLAILSVPLAGGVAATWLWGRRRERTSIAQRLQKFVPREQDENPVTILKAEKSGVSELVERLNGVIDLSPMRRLLAEAAMEDKLGSIISAVILLFALPLLVAIFFNLNLFVSSGVALGLSTVPVFFVKSRADSRRAKFCEQLPDAIDLMVAVLRSGHSVSQAVRAVSQEIPSPCGEEFEAILQRMNLGQPLSDSLEISSLKFQSYELDLLRRAVAIQAEVGGSLAELLDKTNHTLRQRLKLVRQLRVVTAQSRLSAQIVGALPVVLGIGLNIISPGYLNVLTNDGLGQIMLVAVVILEVVGIVVMRRMSTMKV